MFKFARKAFFHGTAAAIKQYLFGAGGNNYGECGVTGYYAGNQYIYPFTQPFLLLAFNNTYPSSLPYTAGEVVYQGSSLVTATATGIFVSYTAGGYYWAKVIPTGGTWAMSGGTIKGVTHTTSYTYASSNNYQASTSPDIWKTLSLRFRSAIGVKSDGTLWVCGDNSHYQLGTGNNTNSGYFVQASPGGNSTGWASCVSGDEFLAALDSNGNIWTVGNNNIAAQCHTGSTAGSGAGAGNGDVANWFNTSTCSTANHPAAVAISSPSGTFTNGEWVYQGTWGSTTWKARLLLHDTANNCLWVSATTGTLATGTVIGNSSAKTATVTSATTTPPVFKQLWGGHRYVAALDANQRLWTWGNNGGDTELGRISQSSDSSASDYVSNPTQDLNCRFVNYTGSDPWPGKWLNVFPGAYNCAALSTDGNMYGWGSNSYGQLGSTSSGSTGLAPFVIPCPGGPTRKWVSADFGPYYGLYLRDDGTLWACGQNSSGQCGVNGTSNITSGTSGTTYGMLQIPNPTTGQWAQVSCGTSHVLAIDTNGYLWGWGSNQQRQLGISSGTGTFTPTLIDNTRQWSLVTAGYYSSIALSLT